MKSEKFKLVILSIFLQTHFVVAQTGDNLNNQPDLAKIKDTSATGSMAEVQQKNEKGNVIYKVAGVALAGYAANEFMKAQACSSQCSTFGGGCCSKAPGFAAAGAAFMLLNAKANNQADQHAASALEACKAFNQLSSAQKDCSGPGTTTQIIPPVTEWYDSEGKCKSSAPPECKNIPGIGSGSLVGKLPSNCKDASGKTVSCITAGLGSFKQNPDGSIKVKIPNGDKTYTMADFADKKSMMDAGLSAAQADSLMNELYGTNSILAKAGLEAKDLAKSNSKQLGDFSSSNTAASSMNLDPVENASKKFGEKLESAVAQRGPSSEGLSRDYNGDLIGAAGDNIFIMLKRRYNLKTAQDTFISP